MSEIYRRRTCHDNRPGISEPTSDITARQGDEDLCGRLRQPDEDGLQRREPVRLEDEVKKVPQSSVRDAVGRD